MFMSVMWRAGLTTTYPSMLAGELREIPETAVPKVFVHVCESV
tara:strand:+ start:588 stop:716 length:129 start_codon:yes stop_codon:yes gene_type:complete